MEAELGLGVCASVPAEVPTCNSRVGFYLPGK